MAVTCTNQLKTPYKTIGNRKMTVTDVEFDSSYLSGGETLTPKNLGFSQFVSHSSCNIKAVEGTVNVASAFYDIANEVIHLYDETPAEVASTANVEKDIVQVTAYGI